MARIDDIKRKHQKNWSALNSTEKAKRMEVMRDTKAADNSFISRIKRLFTW